MRFKPIKKRFFVGLNIILGLVFLVGFAIILYSVNPFQAKPILLILFYALVFALLLVILNFISLILRISFGLRILISIFIVVILIIQSSRL